MKKIFSLHVIDELLEKIVNVLPQDVQLLKEETQQNLRAVLLSVFEKMELVTREEFEIQKKVLARAQAQVEQLAQEIEQLKSSTSHHE